MVLSAKGFIFCKTPGGIVASVSYRAQNLINEENNQISCCLFMRLRSLHRDTQPSWGWAIPSHWDCLMLQERLEIHFIYLEDVPYSKPKHLFTVLCFGNMNSPGMFYTGGRIFGRINESSHFDRYQCKWLCPTNIYNEQKPSSNQ